MDKLKKKLPENPGVYFFKKGKKVLYIGKASSLRDRVRSYFAKDLMETRGPKLVEMLESANTVDYQETDSVIEALVLEAKLIKKYQPKYNTKERDDRSFNYVVITREEFPRVLVVRGKELLEDWDEEDVKYKFGPFPQSTELRTALKILRKILPYRDTCEPESGERCFNAQIGLCPGVCDGSTSKTKYARTVRSIKLFFEGKKGDVLKGLKKHMETEAKKENFEEAARLRNKIFALEHINDIALIKGEAKERDVRVRVEAYDIAHISGTATVGAMVVVEDGQLAKHEYKKFKLKGRAKDRSDDIANLEEVLRRRFSHSDWRSPDLVVIDGGRAQKARAEKVLNELAIDVQIVSVVKDERHKAREIMGDSAIIKDYHSDILLANQEAHRFALAYHRKLRSKL